MVYLSLISSTTRPIRRLARSVAALAVNQHEESGELGSSHCSENWPKEMKGRCVSLSIGVSSDDQIRLRRSVLQVLGINSTGPASETGPRAISRLSSVVVPTVLHRGDPDDGREPRTGAICRAATELRRPRSPDWLGWRFSAER